VLKDGTDNGRTDDLKTICFRRLVGEGIKKLANGTHRYEGSELLVFSHFQLDVFVTGFLFHAVFRVRLEYLVELSHKQTRRNTQTGVTDSYT